MCRCSVCGVSLHRPGVHAKAVPAARDYTRTYIIPGKSRTCEKDDAPYLADKNPSKYRARFVIFKEKPL